MITEKTILVEIIEEFLNLSPQEFVEEYNRITDSRLIIDDILWKATKENNHEKIQYQIW